MDAWFNVQLIALVLHYCSELSCTDYYRGRAPTSFLLTQINRHASLCEFPTDISMETLLDVLEELQEKQWVLISNLDGDHVESGSLRSKDDASKVDSDAIKKVQVEITDKGEDYLTGLKLELGTLRRILDSDFSVYK